MACGTPVIAFRQGSVPEQGESGFIVDSKEEAVEAVKQISKLNRRRVRAAFERRFTSRRVAEDYVRHYHSLATSRLVPTRWSA
jgi:glycosyltransferase involved in cell wall biosynthesis